MGRVGYVSHPAYLLHDMGPSHPESPDTASSDSRPIGDFRHMVQAAAGGTETCRTEMD